MNGFAALAAGLKVKAEALGVQTASDIEIGAARRSRYDTSPGREDDPRPHMRDLWTHDKTGDLEWTVSNDSDHVLPNEYGTIHMSAQPMLHPAIDEARPAFAQGLARLLEP